MKARFRQRVIADSYAASGCHRVNRLLIPSWLAELQRFGRHLRAAQAHQARQAEGERRLEALLEKYK